MKIIIGLIFYMMKQAREGWGGGYDLSSIFTPIMRVSDDFLKFQPTIWIIEGDEIKSRQGS